MKKIFAAIVTAFLMSAGLVATASSPAAAACTYPDECFATETNAIGLDAGPNKAKVFVKVSSFGNGRPTGSIQFTFVRKNGQSVTFTRPYPAPRGDKNVYTFGGLRPGKYTVIASFIPADDSQYLGSSDTAKVKVKKPARRR